MIAVDLRSRILYPSTSQMIVAVLILTQTKKAKLNIYETRFEG